MARVLEFREVFGLKDGETVYEDWLYGTGTMEIVKVKAGMDPLGKKYVVGRYKDGEESRLYEDREFRFWDDEPTMEERQMEPWRR